MFLKTKLGGLLLKFRRFIAFEDGNFIFNKLKLSKAPLIGVFMEKFKIIKLFCDLITVDGLDSTDKILSILDSVESVDCILLRGISYGGFNAVNPLKIYKIKNIPIIIFLSKKPRPIKVKSALVKHFDDWKKRWKIFTDTGKFEEFTLKTGEKIYVKSFGINEKEAFNILKFLILVGKTPEPLRVARLLAENLDDVIKTSLKSAKINLND